MATCLTLTMSACAGSERQANLVPVREEKDMGKSCVELQAEIYQTNLRAGEKNAIHQNQKETNVYLGLAIPLALNMDVSKTDWQEAKALGKRRDYLAKLFNQFGCEGYLGFSPQKPVSLSSDNQPSLLEDWPQR